MLEVNGQRYITASEAPDFLGSDVKPDRVRDWGRRRLATGYRVGHLTYYRLAELEEVEFVMRNSTRGNKRG